jgi:4-hydroxy-2-oxoglutarate aldolase
MGIYPFEPSNVIKTIISKCPLASHFETAIMAAFLPPPFGVYSPMVTFFHQDESIDFDSMAKHIIRLASSGVKGIVVHGSNGEATHLVHSERANIIRDTREILNKYNFSDVTIIAGCSANSVRETLVYISEAKDAGANYALILPPSYWAAAMSKPVITRFYCEVSNDYLFPGSSSKFRPLNRH